MALTQWELIYCCSHKPSFIQMNQLTSPSRGLYAISNSLAATNAQFYKQLSCLVLEQHTVYFKTIHTLHECSFHFCMKTAVPARDNTHLQESSSHASTKSVPFLRGGGGLVHTWGKFFRSCLCCITIFTSSKCSHCHKKCLLFRP